MSALLLPSIPPMPGSQWLELTIAAGLKWPAHHVGPAHGSPARWDWGVTVRSLAEATQRHERLVSAAVGLTAAERDALWSDPSPEAAELRRVTR